MNLHLERMADYCVTVAKLTKLMGGLDVSGETILSSLEDMGQRAEQMIRVALDAFAERDLEKAKSLHELDELIDRANRRAVEDVLSLGDPWTNASMVCACWSSRAASNGSATTPSISASRSRTW